MRPSALCLFAYSKHANGPLSLQAPLTFSPVSGGLPTHLLDAERLSTGTSNQAFESFTDAVNRLRMANYDHYNAILKEIQGTLQTLIPLSTLLFPFTGLLAVWGISRRLRDF
jgi:hypothetical protein